jgi:twitching motility protein PilT
MELFMLLEEMVGLQASDLHMKAGRPPGYRVRGAMSFPLQEKLTVEDLQQFFKQALDEKQRAVFERDHEVDLAISMPGLGRFRGNIYMQRGTVAMVFRHIPTDVPDLSSLNLPDVAEKLAMSNRGLILVTGMTGSGKSTTLAAMIKRILETRPVSVITLEDPTEFLHQDGLGVVTQRDVGSDTDNFNAALRNVLHQDPDILVIGEIRDAVTMRVALTAADTGHLVMSTLHTTDAIQTINRVLSLFPPEQHNDIRYLLAHNLRGIMGMRLLPTKDGKGRVPATEVLMGCATVREYLLEPEKLPMIRDFIEEGGSVYGTRTFDQSLLELYQADLIAEDEAMRQATYPDELRLRMSGIESGESMLQPMGGEERSPFLE